MSWEDLVAAALLGTERCRPELDALPGALGQAATSIDRSDPQAALLDAAALATTYHRAGYLPGRTDDRPSPAPADPAPVPGRAAVQRLADLSSRNDTDLLAMWLEAAAKAGYRAPEAMLPTLLDMSIRHRDLAPAVVRVLGERGRWLAGFRSDWGPVLAADPAMDLAAPAEDSLVWNHGDPAKRRAWFAATRRREPAVAREALAESWKRETGPDRAAFLELLAPQLGPDDESLLEAALDDRHAEVRATAGRLLAVLPRSALSCRMVDRALACVRVERRMRRSWLVVTPPPERDRP